MSFGFHFSGIPFYLISPDNINKSVIKYRKQNSENNSSGTKRGRTPNVCDSFKQSVIRNVSHQLYASKENPAIDKILDKCIIIMKVYETPKTKTSVM